MPETVNNTQNRCELFIKI